MIPEPYFGPADNEIWYTSSNGDVVTPSDSFGVSIVSNEYNNGKGVITFDGPVTNIENSSFDRCTSLTSITIPNSVTRIGDAVFYECSSLTSVTIPNSVTSIGSNTLESTGIYNNESNWENDALYIDNCLIAARSSISGAYAIKENTRLIADFVFDSCDSITSVTIPNSVTCIGDAVFNNCAYLISVTIPSGVTRLGPWTFGNCISLTSMTFEGTTEEWNSITKEYNWNYRVPATYVQCTDGQVTL